MKESFKGYYPLTESQLKVAWEQAIFILDTNVILDLYRLPITTRNTLLATFREVNDRLWIPHQVALEYQENRLTVINEQVSTFEQVQKALEGTQNKLNSELDKLQLKKRHSLINPGTFLEDINSRFNKFKEELENLKKRQPDVKKYDDLRDEIDDLFKGKIGSVPESQDELERIYEEGKSRYKRKQPPGYGDEEKREEAMRRGEQIFYLHRGLIFERQFGDLILWKEIIKEAQIREDWDHIIFITSEEKEDWWWKFKGTSSRKEMLIGARPELVREIVDEAGVSTFTLYQLDSFLRDAEEFLGIQVSEEAVKQVSDIVQLKSSVKVRWLFPITDKFFVYDRTPQKIVVRFTNQSQSPLQVHRILYSDAVSGLQMNMFRPYPKNDQGRLVVYSDMNGDTVLPGDNFVLEIDLAAKWEPDAINRWAGEWGYLRVLVTLEDSPEEIEEFYSI